MGQGFLKIINFFILRIRGCNWKKGTFYGIMVLIYEKVANTMKNTNSILLVFTAIIIFSIMLTGCINQDEKKDINEINQSAIEKVLRKSLTCPSLTSLEDINPNTPGISIVGKDTDEASEKSDINPIDEELRNMYEPYLTENYYEKFIGTHAMTFEIAARRAGFEIIVDSVNITPKENDSIGYTFKVNVTYWKDIEDKYTAEVLGNAQCMEKGKISFINYIDDSALLENMVK